MIQTEIITGFTDLEILDSLLNFACSVDNDFSGENGEDYLWDVAKEHNYKSNADYVYTKCKLKIQALDYHRTEERTEELIYDFLEQWMGMDYNYYDCYTVTPINSSTFVISYTTNY